jgi:uncharacterized protein YbjT (DUF2867 family)
MAGKRILVTAASGKSATHCVRKLAAQGLSVRAAVRRAETREAVQAAGAHEVVIADLQDGDAVRAAMRGVESVLHICPPMHPQEDVIAADMIAAAQETGVSHFILWSVLHPHAAVPHHQRKQKAETTLIDSGIPYTILQPGRYMHHLEAIWSMMLKTGKHAFPFATTSRFSLVHLDDLASAAAKVASEDGHLNAIYELAGPEALSQEDCAVIIAKQLQREIVAERIDLDMAAQRSRANGMPEWRVETMRIMNDHYDHHGLAGNGNVLRWILGRNPITFTDYVRELSQIST